MNLWVCSSHRSFYQSTSAKPVPVPILHAKRDTSCVVTKLRHIHTYYVATYQYAVSTVTVVVGNAMPCHQDGIHILLNRETKGSNQREFKNKNKDKSKEKKKMEEKTEIIEETNCHAPPPEARWLTLEKQRAGKKNGPKHHYLVLVNRVRQRTKKREITNNGRKQADQNPKHPSR